MVVKDIDIANYTDDSTSFMFEENIENIIVSLEETFNALVFWFQNNRLKINADKCHALASTNP